MRNLWLLWIIHLITLPIKVLVSLGIKKSWRPALIKQSCTDICEDKYPELTIEQLKELVDTKLINKANNFNHLNAIAKDDDSAKWYGLLEAAFGHDTDVYWERLMSYIDDDGVIGRCPVDETERRNNAKNFSGDMFSGLGIATATRIKNRKLLKTDREKLIKLWNKTTFDKPVITFAHPKDGKEYSDRGELFSWYDLGSDILKLLAWFELGYQLTGDVRYRKWYKRFKFISMPLLWINIGAMDIAYGKYFIIRWYTYHSRILHMAAGYLTSEDPIFKRSAKAIYDRYGFWNLDVRAIYKTYFNVNLSEAEMRSFYLGLLELSEKGIESYPGVLTPWTSITGYLSWILPGLKANGKNILNKITFNLIPALQLTDEDKSNLKFEKVLLADRFLAFKYLGSKYNLENNPLKPTISTEARRSDWAIDSLVPWKINNQSEK